MLDIEKLKSEPLVREPFEYVIVDNFIAPEYTEKVLQDYPKINKPGSIPLPLIPYGGSFKALINELNGETFRKVVEEKFSLSLAGRPTMFSVRGQCRLRDGKIHTDTESKIITVLLYMNPAWENQGGKLRLLRSPNIEDYITEISPDIGTLLVFKRSDNSFHGHLPYEGKRQAIQMNWVTEQKFVDHETKRHGISLFIKNLKQRLGGY